MSTLPIFRLISERTVEENILKKANQKRMLGDMAIEGGNFTTAFFKEVQFGIILIKSEMWSQEVICLMHLIWLLLYFLQQTIRELFDVNDGEKREAAVELTLPPAEEEETVIKQSTNILEQVGAIENLN